jgi:hypothetical protein
MHCALPFPCRKCLPHIKKDHTCLGRRYFEYRTHGMIATFSIDFDRWRFSKLNLEGT